MAWSGRFDVAKRSPAPAEPSPFQALLQRLEIRDVQMVAEMVTADVGFVRRHGQVDGNVEVALDVRSEPSLMLGGGQLECLLTFHWRVFEPAGEQPLVSVEERYLLSYSVTGTEPVADDTLRAFADNNAAFNAWSFFRQSLHATTLRMGLPPFTLPLLKPRTPPRW